MDLPQALALFHIESINELYGLASTDRLKRQFKKAMQEAHPDRGGEEGFFEKITEAYLLLRTTLARSTGGRENGGVIDVAAVIEQREKQYREELNNMVFDWYSEQAPQSTTDEKSIAAAFNAMFEKYRANGMEVSGTERPMECTNDDEKWNDNWDRVMERQQREKEQREQIYYRDRDSDRDAIIAQDSTLTSSNFNQRFEGTARHGKPAPTALILHPEQMAVGNTMGNTMGTLIVPADSTYVTVTGKLSASRVMDVYDQESTFIDKIPEYKAVERTFEQLQEEHNITYKPELDRDLEAIAAYECEEQERAAEHKRKLASFFRDTGSSMWALPSLVATASTDKQPFVHTVE